MQDALQEEKESEMKSNNSLKPESPQRKGTSPSPNNLLLDLMKPAKEEHPKSDLQKSAHREENNMFQSSAKEEEKRNQGKKVG